MLRLLFSLYLLKGCLHQYKTDPVLNCVYNYKVVPLKAAAIKPSPHFSAMAIKHLFWLVFE